jgi:class 3 adenylate cyclase
MANKGTVDKFIGDAVMGIWNAPMGRDTQERKRTDFHFTRKRFMVPRGFAIGKVG